MQEKEFKDDKGKLMSSVFKYDSASGNLSYCGTICLQMNDEALLKPTTEFFSMILYNSDPNSKVFLRRVLNPANVTKVSPQDDIEGINNFDIFVIQVRESGLSWSRAFIFCYTGGGQDPLGGHSGLRQVHHTENQRVPRDSEVRPMLVISALVNVKFFRPKSGADDRILQVSLDGTQEIRHMKAKVNSLSPPPS